MAVYKRKNSPVLWIEFVHEGRRFRQSTGTRTLRKAEEFERQLRQRVYDELTLGKATYEPMRFHDAVSRYVAVHLKTKSRLDKSDETNAYMLAKLVSWVGADTLLDRIDTAAVANLKERIFDYGKRKPATANKYLAALRAILRMAHFEWSRLRELPRFKLFPLKNERTRWLRQEEEVRLLSACKNAPHLYDLSVLLVDTGARLSEGCRLTWNDVELPKRGKGLVRLFATKTQKMRSVPLTKRADQLLRKLHAVRLPDQERVFLVRMSGTKWRGTQPQAKPFTNPYGAWKTAVSVADLHDVRMHDLRHTFASRLVQRGVPLLTVAELLGHSSLKMTMRYAHLATQTLRHAVAKLD